MSLIKMTSPKTVGPLANSHEVYIVTLDFVPINTEASGPPNLELARFGVGAVGLMFASQVCCI